MLPDEDTWNVRTVSLYKLAEQGDKSAAEKELVERRDRHAEFDIRRLERQARESYRERWELTQRHFVDAPEGAVGDAHTLVREAMHDRG